MTKILSGMPDWLKVVSVVILVGMIQIMIAALSDQTGSMIDTFKRII